MKIPTSFTCAGQLIKVIIEDKLPHNDYGYWCNAKNEIHLARYLEVQIEDDIEDVKLKPEQIENTFWHELKHCFQFFYNNDISEADAQVFANQICEFFKSSKYAED